jgi:hypothetical protein
VYSLRGDFTMSSAPDPERGKHRPHRDQQTASESSAELPPDMLRDVVAETSARLATPENLDPALRAAMLEVARRFAGQPMTVDPAGTALLEAVLRFQIPALAGRGALLSRTARVVATSLLTDPLARLRVEHLWATLAEEAA